MKLYQLTTGRRLFALRQVREHAVPLGTTALVERIDAAIAHDRATWRLELAWSGKRLQSSSGNGVGEVDHLLDRGLVGLRDMAVAVTEGAREDDPVHDRADRLLGAIFPAGVLAVISLPYVDQLAAAETIVSMLQGELASLVAELGLEAHVARIATLTAEYRAALDARPERVQFAQLRAARDAGHAFVCEVVAMILGTYHLPHDADHALARSALLGPILAQNEALRVYRGRRRAVVDVDPDTGEADADESVGEADAVDPDTGEADADESVGDTDAAESAGVTDADASAASDPDPDSGSTRPAAAAPAASAT